MEMVAASETPAVSFNPFPGLRPFRTDEDYLFFGREGQSEEILRRLRQHRFLSVVGTSGSGKSSLIRAGLLPYLFGGFMSGAGSHWRVAVFRPGNNPIGNLAGALNDPAVMGEAEADAEAARRRGLLLEATLRRGGLGLIEAVRLSPLPERDNILIVVDQFEELFRFADAASSARKEEDAAAFVKLLIEAGRQSELPVYVVITMRSDFIGDCARFHDLPETVTAGLYLIPRMTREQRRAAIEGPVKVGSAAISRQLINRLLNDGGDDPDQLPSLQHALMRTWAYWEARQGGPGAADVPAIDVAAIHVPAIHVASIDVSAIDVPAIEVADYVAVGGIAEALSRHAEEAYAELPFERHRNIAKRLFQTLTEKGPDNREVRRPTRVADIAAMAQAEVPQTIEVIEYFRREGRSFLMPPPEVALDGDSVIDISHESLIRGWQRLKAWVEEETDSARMYRRLAETAALHAQGKAGLWHDPDLSNGLLWREAEKPNAAWAKCYHPNFAQAMAFLERSRLGRDEELAEGERRRRDELRKVRVFAAAITGLFLIALALTGWAWREKNLAQAASQEARNRTGEAQRSAAMAARQAQMARAAEGKAYRAARQAEEAQDRAEAEKRAAQRAREGEIVKAREARLALRNAQAQKARADESSRVALEFAGSALSRWSNLSDAITEQHDMQDMYESLLQGAEGVHKTIMNNSPENQDVMVLWVIDLVGIPELHYRQGKTRQAREECAEHERTGKEWGRDANDFKRLLGTDILAYSAKTRMRLGDEQAALADARLAASIGDAVLAPKGSRDDRSWRDLSVAYGSAGEVEEHYKHWKEALADYRQSVAARQKMAAPDADSRHFTIWYMRRAADIELTLGRSEDALQTFQQAVDYAEASIASAAGDGKSPHSVNEQALTDAAGVYVDRGDAEAQKQLEADAERDFKLAREKAAAAKSTSEEVLFQLSLADERLGNMWYARALKEKDAGKKADCYKRAAAFHQPALDERIRVVKLHNTAETELNLGYAEENLGHDYLGLGDAKQTLEHYQARLKAYRLSAELNASDDLWRRVANASRDLALRVEREESLTYYRGAAEAGRKIAQPDAETRTSLLADLTKIAELEASPSRYAEAIEYARAGMEGTGKPDLISPELISPDLISKVFWLYTSRGDLELESGDYAETAKDYDAARAEALRLDEKASGAEYVRAVADERLGNLYLAESGAEKNDAGRKELALKAVQLHARALERFRKAADKGTQAIEENNLARDYQAIKEFDTARQHYRASIALYREAQQAAPSDVAARQVAEEYKALSSLEQLARDYPAARLAMDRQIEVLQQLAAKNSASQTGRTLLSEALGDRSWVDLFVGDFRGAIEDADRGWGYDNAQLWILINKAHAYLFSGQTDTALRIYTSHADEPAFPNNRNSKKYGPSVLDDFEQFRKEAAFKNRLAAVNLVEERLKLELARNVQQAAVAPQNSVRR